MKPLLITAPSGCGKGTLINRLIKEYPHYFELSISFTTRHPRVGEVDGVNYYFVSKELFKKEIEEGNFIEYVEYSGNYYGTNKKKIEEI